MVCFICRFNLLTLFFFIACSFSSVQSLSHVWLFATPWTAARQASLSITNSQSSLRLTSIESVMPSSHLILCHPLLLRPSIFPIIRVFSSESALLIRWPDVISSIYFSSVFLSTFSIGCKLQGTENLGSYHIPSPKRNRGSHDRWAMRVWRHEVKYTQIV